MIFYETIRYFKSSEHHMISMGDLKDDIRRGESQTLELKRDLSDNPLKYVRTAVAFANGRGGRIVLGVDDSHEIVGLEGDPWRVADVAVDTIMNRCEPQVPVESYVVTVDGKDLVVLEVSPGQNRPYHLKSSGVGNSTYVRISATTRLADEERLRDLMLEGRRASYDAMDHTGIILDPGSPEVTSMCSYLSGRGSGRFDATRLANMGLIREGHGGYIPSRAFMMLSTNPFPHAMVQCARFRGQDRTVFLDRKEYGGNLMEQVEAATGFILNYLPCRAEIGAVYRRDIFEIPQEAVREAVTNAVLQGLNRMDLPIRHSAIALIVHVAVLEILLLGLKLGIYSVVIANIVFALVMCLLNGFSIRRAARYQQEIKKTFLLPALCSVFMGAAAYGVYRGLLAALPWAARSGRLGMAVLVVPSVAAAMAVYGLLLVRLGAVNEEELREMPMGTRLTRIFKRLRLL